MPLAYGGGVSRLDHVKAVIGVGVEKVVINSAAVGTPKLVEDAARMAGSSSIVVSIDVRQGRWPRRDYEVCTHAGTRRTGLHPVEFAAAMERAGAGEILLTAIDRDGTMEGYDLDLVRSVTRAVSVPVIACGGAGRVTDLFRVVKEGGASAAAAGQSLRISRAASGSSDQLPPRVGTEGRFDT